MLTISTAALLTASTVLADAPPPDPGGTWAVELTMVTAAKVPVLGSLDSVTVTTGRLRTVDTSDGVAQQYEVCEVSVEDQGSIVTSSIPEAFVHALPSRIVNPTTWATTQGWGYSLDLGATHVGYDPALSGGRPTTDADHPATVDADGDGAPGATVLISIPMFSDVEIHITQGTRMALDGSWVDDDLITGQVLVTYLEQNVVGASNRLFARSPSVQPVHDRSTFTMVRVPDGASCGELPALVRTAQDGHRAVAALGR
jgi:hypothetical protein